MFLLGIIPSKCVWGHLNGPIHVNCNIFKKIAASAVEAETEGCFVTGRDVIILRNTLEEMGSTAHYTSIRGQYNILCTYKQ